MVGGHGVYVLIVIMLTTVAVADTVVSYGWKFSNNISYVNIFCLLQWSIVSYLSFDNGGLLFTKPLSMDVDVTVTYNGESFKAPIHIQT